MPKRARWALHASTGLLFLSGYLALASVQSFGTPLVAAALIVLLVSPFAERLDRASPGYRLITKAISIAYFCFIPLSLFAFGLLGGVIALIIFIQFYTMLHQKEEKSYYHLFLMSFFLLLAACNQAPEASIGIVLGIFLLATIWSFFSLRVAFEAEESQSHVPPDIVRFGEEPLKQAHDGRDPFDLGVVGYVFALALLSLAITVGIFFATPRVEAGLLGRSNAPINTTGVPDSVQLQSGTTIIEDLTPVLRAEFPDEPEGKTNVFPLYWRITALSKFDGSGWQRAGIERSGEDVNVGARRQNWYSDSYSLQRRAREGERLVHQIIYMDDVPTRGVPVLDLVQKVEITGRPRSTKIDWDDGGDFTVTLAREGARQLHYEAWSAVDDPLPEALRQASGDYDLAEGDFELLTAHDLLPETAGLARQITAAAATNYDKVIALRDYLSGNRYRYSLTLPPLPREFAVDAFINDVRVGHCELFATALALMTRAVGIPARVVSGFKGGDYDPSDGSYIVRNAMAHLWVEVLFPGNGWVKFDPSPAADDIGSRGIFARMQMAASLYALKARMLWFRDVVGYQGSRVFSLDQLRVRLFNTAGEVQARAADVIASENLARNTTAAAMLSGACIAVGYFAFRLVADSRGLRRSTVGHYVLTRDQTRAIKIFRRLRKRLKKAGVETEGQTAEELLALVENTDWPDRAEAEGLLTAYNEARFGGRPLPGERLAELLRTLRGLRLRNPA